MIIYTQDVLKVILIRNVKMNNLWKYVLHTNLSTKYSNYLNLNFQHFTVCIIQNKYQQNNEKVFYLKI